MRQTHTLLAKDKWEATSDFRNNKYNIIAQRNKEDGWGNATQAEINWWKNKGLDENVEDDEYMIGDEGDGNLGYFHVNENIESEYQAYHGSTHNFDKFNHKKYLSTGAGSQVFGWGTYVTNDETIAKSYTEVGDTNDKIVVILNDRALESHLPDEDDAKLLMKCVLPILKQDYPILYDYYCYSLNNDVQNDMFCELYCELFQKECHTDKAKDIYESDKIRCEKRIREDYWWENDDPQAILLQLCRYILFMKNEIDFDVQKPSKLVYTVDIPDDNGENYVDWYEYFPPKFMKRILIGLSQLKPKYLEKMAEKNYPFKCSLYDYIITTSPNKGKLIDILSNEEDYYTFFANGFYSHKKEPIGSSVYHRLREILGSPKAASLFLMQCGFVGIKYPTGTRMKKPIGAREDGQNYVIFDANNVKIIEKNGLNENVETELDVLHGSSYDFNKFNHKKYLGKGAGSQAFGWGTYVTNDESVVQGYRKMNQRDAIKDSKTDWYYDGKKTTWSQLYAWFQQLFASINKEIDSVKAAIDLLTWLQAKKDVKIVKTICTTKYNMAMKHIKGDEVSKRIWQYEYMFSEAALKILEIIDGHITLKIIPPDTRAYKYGVNIPDDNGMNYLSWYDKLSNVQIEMIFKGLLTLKDSLFQNVIHKTRLFHNAANYLVWARKMISKSPNIIKNVVSKLMLRNVVLSNYSFEKIYYMFENTFGSQKAASMFFMHCGFDGIKYPCGTKWRKPDGMKNNAMNYVIFDANKAQIQNKTTYKDVDDEIGETTPI